MNDSATVATPPLWRRPIVRQFVKFCLVGGSSFVIDYCIRLTLLFAVPWHGGSLGQAFGHWLRETAPAVFAYADNDRAAAFPIFAAIAASVAILNSFIWNRSWTFRIRGREEAGRQLRRFVVVSVIGLCLNVLLSTFFNHIISGNEKNSARIATILAALIVAIWNFAGQRLYAFGLRKK